MTYEIEKYIPRQGIVLAKLPLSDELKKQVEKDRAEIFRIIEGKDNRKLLIMGPCSAWPREAVLDYVKMLKPIAEKLKDKIKIVIRVYTQKPRTTIGWTGPINQPDPFDKPNIEKGIFYCRKMMLDIVKEGFAIADEAVFTHNEGYFTDLISWLAIGARSTEDQEHRVFASMIENPIGLKNPTSGDLDVATNSVLAAQNPHVFVLNRKQIRTSGNKHAHLVMRGGGGKPNSDLESIKKAHELMKKKSIENPSIIMDVSHDNSITDGKKDHNAQGKTILEIVKLIKEHSDINKLIKGFMMESFIKSGKQDLTKVKSINDLDLSGLSVTDACLGIEDTISNLEKLYKEL